MFETTKALILREVRYKESDRILTVLTDTDGKRTLKARGALSADKGWTGLACKGF